jgi:hypothetical protein
MGLDMYAYVARKGQHDEYRGQEGDWNPETQGPVSKPIDLAYWRKHPSLHGYMEQLWQKKGMPGGSITDGSFNGVELELTWKDIDDLEQVVRHGKLPFTEGFFFGKPSDNEYYEQDLKFCIDAKAEIFFGFKVFYNSSW